MLVTHQLRNGAPVLTAPPPGPAPADVLRLPAEVLVPGGPFTMGTSTEPWALDNERPARTESGASFLPRHHAGDERGLHWLHRGRRLRRPALVDSGWLGPPAARRAVRAAVLEPGRRRQWAASPIRRDTEPVRRRSQCCTCAGTKPTPTLAGRAGGCQPSAEWEKAARYDPANGQVPPLSVGRRGPDSRRGPISVSGICSPLRPAHTQLALRPAVPGS